MVPFKTTLAAILAVYPVVFISFISATKPVVNSFSNYYATVYANNRNLDKDQIFQRPTPVSVSENILEQYSQSLQLARTKINIRRKGHEHNEGSYSRKVENQGYGYSHTPTHTTHEEKEKDTTLDDLLGVMGPALFLIPFVAKVLPFAIPAIPLSFILSRYEPANLQEIITRLQEIATQINEFLQQTQEAALAVQEAAQVATEG